MVVTSSRHAPGRRFAFRPLPGHYRPSPMDEPPQRPALQSLCPEEVVALAPGVDLGEARKLISQVHRLGDLPTRSPSEVRRRSLDQVRSVTFVPTLRLLGRAASSIDGFVK